MNIYWKFISIITLKDTVQKAYRHAFRTDTI